jgi:hypothetical protein
MICENLCESVSSKDLSVNQPFWLIGSDRLIVERMGVFGQGSQRE